jgi:hypothetical protein
MTGRSLLRLLVIAVIFAVTFATLFAATPLAIWGILSWRHPQDNSAGDAAGWAFLFLSPMLIIVCAAISFLVALLAWRWLPLIKR